MVGGRWIGQLGRLAVAVGALTTTAAAMPACSPITQPTTELGSRPADVEFSLRRGAGAAERRTVAMELWSSGSVGSVTSPNADTGDALYKVYVKQPGNLVHIQDVYLRLRRMPEVLSVHSAVARFLGER